METKHNRIAAVTGLAMLVALSVGCATSQRYETEMPTEDVDDLFFHMAKEADARGYETERDAYFDTLSIELDTGRLEYALQHGRVVVEITISPRSEARDSVQALRTLGEELAEAARRRMSRSARL